MKIEKTKLSGVYILEPNSFEDHRGSFIKVFHDGTFLENNIDFSLKESFYSVSRKNVIRGMHFHIPPKDHAKIVYVTSGKILDVVLDLRKNSETYGEYVEVELSSENKRMIHIPEGCAHGYISLEDNSCTVYLQSGEHSPEHDTGIHYNSFGKNWGDDVVLISKKDENLIRFDLFESPF